MSLTQKLLLASKSPATDIPFHDVLVHIICFVTVVEDAIPFIIPKTSKIKLCQQNELNTSKSYYYIFLANGYNLIKSGGKVYKINLVTDN